MSESESELPLRFLSFRFLSFDFFRISSNLPPLPLLSRLEELLLLPELSGSPLGGTRREVRALGTG